MALSDASFAVATEPGIHPVGSGVTARSTTTEFTRPEPLPIDWERRSKPSGVCQDVVAEDLSAQ